MLTIALFMALGFAKPAAPAYPPNVPQQPAPSGTVAVTGPNGRELHLQLDDKYANAGYLFGLFGACIAAGSLILNLRQVKLAEKQTALSQAAAELARESAVAASESARAAREGIEVSKKNIRALVTITPAPDNHTTVAYPEGTGGGKLEIVGINSFNLIIKNQGSTSAHLDKAAFRYEEAQSLETASSLQFPDRAMDLKGELLPAGQEKEHEVSLESGSIDSITIYQLAYGIRSGFLLCRAHLSYRDVFDDVHQTVFTYMIDLHHLRRTGGLRLRAVGGAEFNRHT
jgi:hypothetical protein